MTKEHSAGNDNPERKDGAQMPVLLSSRHLYPEWETVGEPYMDLVPGSEEMRELVMIRKRFANE